MNKRKPSFWDRVIGFVTATPAKEVKRSRDRKNTPRPAPETKLSSPKIPTLKDFEQIPEAAQKRFVKTSSTLKDLEWVIMDPQAPEEVRQAAAQRWAREAPKPLRPHMPRVVGLGHDNYWRAFREAYGQEQEV